MKNAYEILAQKKAQLIQLELEIAALELVIPMLNESQPGQQVAVTSVDFDKQVLVAGGQKWAGEPAPKANGNAKSWP